MKEKIKKITRCIKNYLPDILFLLGVLVLSYNLLRSTSPLERILDKYAHSTDYKVAGIFLIALAIDITIRRYFARKRERNSE